MKLTRVLTLVALAGAMALALLAGYVASASVGGEPIGCPIPPDQAVPRPRLIAPATLRAGASLQVRLLARDEPRALPATVALLRADGAITRETVLRSGVAEVTFGQEATTAAGSFSITAAVCDQTIERAIVVRPGAPVAPLDPLIGPRRITADGSSEATAVTLPIDGMGNPIAAGSEVRYELRRPDGRRESERVRTAHLLGVLRVRSGTKAGRTGVAAISGSARSTAADLIETPGRPPAGFPITVREGIDQTVGASDREVVLDRITDAHGNVLPEGTLITVLVDGPGMAGRSLQAPLSDGSARIPLAAPVGAGDVRVQALIDGVTSSPVVSRFAPRAVTSEVPLDVRPDTDLGLLSIEVGPVLGDLGAYVPDGTVAILRITRPDGWTEPLELRLTDGQGMVEWAAPHAGRYIVRVETPYGSTKASEVMR